MEILTITDHNEKTSLVARVWSWLQHSPMKLVDDVVEIATTTKKLAKDDPRRVIHSFKVGISITLVSMFYYFQPLYNSFGVSAMWAVMTVVVVFEFTVGATLGKGLNRTIATLLAGGLGVGLHHLGNLCSKIGEPILIGFFVFIFAAVTTFMRFFPTIKARYDYGFLIFILTFSFISISGYRADEIIELAHKRLSTIAIGGLVSLMINIFLFPVWAGEELHNSLALNLEKLGVFLEGFGAVYLRTPECENNSMYESKSSFQSYRSILNSKSSEDSMANFARWEPRHGHFRYNHPWKQYVELASLIRQCAYRIDALNACFNSNDTKKPQKFQEEFKDVCTKISMESSKALIKLGSCLRERTYPSSSVNPHIVSSKAAVKTLQTCLKLGTLYNQNSDLLQIIPIGTMASLLIDIVDCTEKITGCANDLATLARFKKISIKDPNNLVSISKSKSKPKNVNQHEGVINQVCEVDKCTEVVIEVATLTLMMSKSTQENTLGANSNGQQAQHSIDD